MGPSRWYAEHGHKTWKTSGRGSSWKLIFAQISSRKLTQCEPALLSFISDQHEAFPETYEGWDISFRITPKFRTQQPGEVWNSPLQEGVGIKIQLLEGWWKYVSVQRQQCLDDSTSLNVKKWQSQGSSWKLWGIFNLWIIDTKTLVWDHWFALPCNDIGGSGNITLKRKGH